MKSLGVQKVHIEYYTDNIKTKSEIEKRVVYSKADGTFWCNYFAGGQRQVTKRKNGSFYWRIDVAVIAMKNISDILRGIGR
jgi:hypothetical protein